jgi:hypothetical protein
VQDRVADRDRSAPFLVEAVFAVLALMVLLVLLSWLYRVARPLVEELAWVTLDAALATTTPDSPPQSAISVDGTRQSFSDTLVAER